MIAVYFATCRLPVVHQYLLLRLHRSESLFGITVGGFDMEVVNKQHDGIGMLVLAQMSITK